MVYRRRRRPSTSSTRCPARLPAGARLSTDHGGLSSAAQRSQPLFSSRVTRATRSAGSRPTVGRCAGVRLPPAACSTCRPVPSSAGARPLAGVARASLATTGLSDPTREPHRTPAAPVPQRNAHLLSCGRGCGRPDKPSPAGGAVVRRAPPARLRRFLWAFSRGAARVLADAAPERGDADRRPLAARTSTRRFARDAKAVALQLASCTRRPPSAHQTRGR